jgi:hypothetical protein
MAHGHQHDGLGFEFAASERPGSASQTDPPAALTMHVRVPKKRPEKCMPMKRQGKFGFELHGCTPGGPSPANARAKNACAGESMTASSSERALEFRERLSRRIVVSFLPLVLAAHFVYARVNSTCFPGAIPDTAGPLRARRHPRSFLTQFRASIRSSWRSCLPRTPRPKHRHHAR